MKEVEGDGLPREELVSATSSIHHAIHLHVMIATCAIHAFLERSETSSGTADRPFRGSHGPCDARTLS